MSYGGPRGISFRFTLVTVQAAGYYYSRATISPTFFPSFLLLFLSVSNYIRAENIYLYEKEKEGIVVAASLFRIFEIFLLPLSSSFFVWMCGRGKEEIGIKFVVFEN